MIVIISSSAREASSLAALVENRPRPSCTCASISQFRTQLRKAPPALVLTRASLVDGYSDDIFALLAKSDLLPATRVIVLAAADCTPRQEARHLALGADCVLKDPVRPEVLLEYAAKFLRASPQSRFTALPSDQFTLAGATISPSQQQVHRDKRSTHLSPKEIQLARLLAESPGKTVTYEVLYSELLNRAFSGESANLRVLLGKLATSYRKLGIDLRATIRVTPKTGYCYIPPAK